MALSCFHWAFLPTWAWTTPSRWLKKDQKTHRTSMTEVKPASGLKVTSKQDETSGQTENSKKMPTSNSTLVRHLSDYFKILLLTCQMGGPKWMSLSYWKGNKTADTDETKQATHYPCGCANKKGLLAPKAGFNINASWSCDITPVERREEFGLRSHQICHFPISFPTRWPCRNSASSQMKSVPVLQYICRRQRASTAAATRAKPQIGMWRLARTDE